MKTTLELKTNTFGNHVESESRTFGHQTETTLKTKMAASVKTKFQAF
jgi:hypothetical protein